MLIYILFLVKTRDHGGRETKPQEPHFPHHNGHRTARAWGRRRCDCLHGSIGLGFACANDLHPGTTMAGDVLRLLLRKKTAQAGKVARAAPAERMGRAVMIERRDHCMAEIIRLRANGDASGNLAVKAYQLLTAHWAASSWRSRADIVRSAEWLLGISRKAAGPAVAPSDRARSNGGTNEQTF